MTADSVLDAVLKVVYSKNISTIDFNPYAFTVEKFKDSYNKHQFDKFLNGDQIDGFRSPSELQEIFEKLAKDGYIRQTHFEKGPDVFSVTFDGRWFVENGGYTTQTEKESSKTKRANLEKTILTVGAAMTGVYGVVQIGESFRYWAPGNFSISSLTAIFLLGSGVLIGLSIWLIIKELLQFGKDKQS